MTCISDDEDEGFEDLTNNNDKDIMQSVRGTPEPKLIKTIRVQIKESDHVNQAIIVESQYYLVSVFRQNTVLFKQLKKRFSDFDFLFEILFRIYKGYILPAFPENGIVSYVKSKVSLTKDDKFLKQRISMVQRFLTIILNTPRFNFELCQETKAFLTQGAFDLFKKKQKQSSQGIISSSWIKIVSYIKMNKESRFKIYQNQVMIKKKQFEQIENKVKGLVQLLQQQNNLLIALESKDLTNFDLNHYLMRQKKLLQNQQINLNKVRQLLFSVTCQNQDFQMVLKTLRHLEQLRGNQKNYACLDEAQRIFSDQYEQFKANKQKSLLTIKAQQDKFLKQISHTDSTF